MLFIQKNQINTLILSLRELSSIAYSSSTVSTAYLFSFWNPQTDQTINFIPVSNTGMTSSQYDYFSIIESGVTSQNLTGGTINLDPLYFWHYTIYENLSNPYNLQISATTGAVIERGKVLVTGNTDYIHTSYTYTGQSTYTVYTPNY